VSDLISPANFDFFARYLLAGFILMSVRSSFVSAQRPRPTEVLFDAVFLSLVNQLIFLAIASLVFWLVPTLTAQLGVDGRLIFFLEVLALPVLLGVLWGIALARDWKIASLRRLMMPNVHPTERAYDFAFARRPGPGFVIITYKDGTQVFGYFGYRSLAATDERRSDIYLERLYSVDDDGQWSETMPSRSALLMLDDIRSIEFIPEGGPQHGQETAR
jgi:hypothetical protein